MFRHSGDGGAHVWGVTSIYRAIVMAVNISKSRHKHTPYVNVTSNSNYYVLLHEQIQHTKTSLQDIESRAFDCYNQNELA
jgi:hypothetical protein